MKVHGEAAHAVEPLFRKGLLRSEVQTALTADGRLNPAVREEALKLADIMVENAYELNEASWAVVRNADAGAAANELALRRAEAACRLANNGMNLNTLGVAQYRVGLYREALNTLEPEPLNEEPHKWPNPADVAFIAMAQHQLGQKAQAQATMIRLRKVMQQPEWQINDDAQNFLREAEELLNGKPAAGKMP
jgi:hypothetical protein